MSNNKLVSNPQPVFGKVLDGVIESVNNSIRTAENATPVAAAKAAHNFLSEIGMCKREEDVMYDFDDHYRVYFQDEGFPRMVAEFWAPWMGGVSWKIEEVA